MHTLKLTKKYETYPEYKDSGVEWLGKIPKEWGLNKFKADFKVSDDRVSDYPTVQTLLSVSGYRGIETKNIDSLEGQMPSEDVSDYRIVRPGQLVVNTMWLNYTGLGVSNYEGYVSPAYRAYTISDKLSPRFVNHLMRSNLYVQKYSSLLYGIRPNSLQVKTYDFEKIEILIPPKAEQEKIANYLDEKTTYIDQIIQKKQKQIELLKEKRSAVINYAVNNVSGDSEKLKYIAPERKVKLDTAPSDSKYIGLENIESGTGKLIDSKEKSEPESSVNVFKAGDVLFGKLRPYLAKVFSTDCDGVCSGEFLTLIPKTNKVASKYLFYKLISKDFIKAVDDSTYGAKMPRANWQSIGNLMITYPSLDKQSKIVASLDSKLEVFELSINKVNRSIEILQEFKSSLVSSVVTGKIKI